VVPNKVVEILIVQSGRTSFVNGQAGTPSAVIVHHYVVRYRGVIVGHTPRKVSIRDKDSAFSVLEHKVIGNHYIVGGMPQVDSPSRVAVRNVVENVTTKIGVIDTLNRVALDGRVPNVM